MRIIIIEDESLTAKDLAKTLQRLEPDIEVVAILKSVEEATDYLKSNQDFDLIFSDIELGDGLSFEIFEKLQLTIPIIFCTAYDQYALEAFKTAGIDFILKPFDDASVGNTLMKFKQLKNQLNQSTQNLAFTFTALKNQLFDKLPAVIIREGDKIIPILSSDIVLFYVEDRHTYAYTFSKQKHLVNQKMQFLETTFAPSFFRANRQFLINRKAVKDASYFFNRKLLVNLILPFDEKILIGKLKSSEFIQWLENS